MANFISVVRLSFLSAVSCVYLSTAAAEAYKFEYTPLCAKAYKAYLALRPEEGDAAIRAEFIANPYNLLATYISDYNDFLTLVFNGDPNQYTQRKGHEDARMARLRRASDNEPWKRVCLAGIYMHWALIHIRYGERLNGALAFRRSYILLRENAHYFPAFAPTSVMYGIEEAMASTIPDGYKWLMSIFGIKGNLGSGMARLQTYLKNNPADASPMHEEAMVYDCYTRFYLGSQKEAVWQLANSNASFEISNNILRAFIRANLALSYHKADAAIAAMTAAKAMPGSSNYPVIDYELGSALLFRLNPECAAHLENFAKRNTGRLFTKDALYKAALAWYLIGDKTRAEADKAAILHQGSLVTDADINAQRFAKEGRWPQPLLLRARLLTDGGYSNEALTTMRSVSGSTYAEQADRLEYEFRLGRALEETGDVATAVQCYQRVINTGKERSEDFAARSALQMAIIYEERKQAAEANQYYKICLSMRDHDYQNAIDQQAKAGLARLGH